MCGTDFHIIVLQKVLYLCADNKSANGHPYCLTAISEQYLQDFCYGRWVLGAGESSEMTSNCYGLPGFEKMSDLRNST